MVIRSDNFNLDPTFAVCNLHVGSERSQISDLFQIIFVLMQVSLFIFNFMAKKIED